MRVIDYIALIGLGLFLTVTGTAFLKTVAYWIITH